MDGCNSADAAPLTSSRIQLVLKVRIQCYSVTLTRCRVCPRAGGANTAMGTGRTHNTVKIHIQKQLNNNTTYLQETLIDAVPTCTRMEVRRCLAANLAAISTRSKACVPTWTYTFILFCTLCDGRIITDGCIISTRDSSQSQCIAMVH